MGIILSVILPVFIVLGMGYLAAWRGLMSEAAVDGLMGFAQGIAVPCLLFLAIYRLDLTENFDWRLLVSFYGGALTAFFAGLFGAHFIFGRSWEDSVAIGFAAMFSNSLLLGLPITERAYGPAALSGNYAIIALHTPFLFAVGITAMEIVRSRGGALRHLPGKVLKAMSSNAMIIGILLGAFANVSGLSLPVILVDALDLLARAALPAALFGLGGVLTRYRPEGDMRVILFVVGLSLILHPAVVWLLGTWTSLPTPAFRSAVITAAVAPGVNAYLFADMYGNARRVAASSVLIATLLCMVTAVFWLSILP